jgi:hypothetical protein
MSLLCSSFAQVLSPRHHRHSDCADSCMAFTNAVPLTAACQAQLCHWVAACCQQRVGSQAGPTRISVLATQPRLVAAAAAAAAARRRTARKL